MTNYDGGPAFPRTGNETTIEPQSGMTVRQWYKGMALSGLLADPGETLSHAAINAASLADKLLAEDADKAKEG